MRKSLVALATMTFLAQAHAGPVVIPARPVVIPRPVYVAPRPAVPVTPKPVAAPRPAPPSPAPVVTPNNSWLPIWLAAFLGISASSDDRK